MCVPVLKCHQLQGALPPDALPRALPPGPRWGLRPRPPLQARAPALAILRAKPTLVLFSAAATGLQTESPLFPLHYLHKSMTKMGYTKTEQIPGLPLVRSCGCACFRFTDLLLIGGTSLSMAYHALTTISNSNDELRQHCTAYTSRWYNKIYRTLSNKIYSQKSRDSYFIILI